jgi:YebC/PmpR family DNA-binding regulatory protein
LSTTPPVQSGHSYVVPLAQYIGSVLTCHRKWASIKHDKAKNDAGRSKMRVLLTRDISNAVKLAGADPLMNPRLALALTTAKKNAVPKSTIEAAIARGQGLSASGAALEGLLLEAMLPPSIATIIECQTDNKLRALADLRVVVKDAGGQVGTVGFMFEKKGRIILRKKEGMGVDEILEDALDAGAEDVFEDEEGRINLYTEPAETKSIAETLAKKLEMEIEESEIIYDPNEDTKVDLDDEEAAAKLSNFLDELQEIQGIQGVYMNCSKGESLPAELWEELQGKLAV